MHSASPSPVLLLLLLMDAILRLRSSVFGVLALAMKVKYAELAALEKIFSVSGNEGFHVVPNTFLEAADLGDLTEGAVLPTLDRGKYLVVTTNGGRGGLEKVRIKAYENVKNQKVVVHLFLPFPHLHPATVRGLILSSQHARNDFRCIDAAATDGGVIVNHTERIMTERD